MIKIIVTSIKQLIAKYPLTVLYYLVLLVLGMLVARPVYVTILNEAQKSVALDTLITDFNFMIFSDFLNQSWQAFRPFLSLTSMLILVNYLISNFFHGGILSTSLKSDFKFADFFEGGIKLWPRFLMLWVYSFIFLIVLVSFSGMFFFIFASIAEGGNERTYILYLIPPFLILGLFVSFVVVQNIYSKVLMSQNHQIGPWSAFGKAFTYVFKNPSTLLIYWSLGAISLILVLVYFGIDATVGMRSGITIFVMFLIQQAFVFARSFIKILTIVSAQNYFLANPVYISQPQSEINELKTDD